MRLGNEENSATHLARAIPRRRRGIGRGTRPPVLHEPDSRSSDERTGAGATLDDAQEMLAQAFAAAPIAIALVLPDGRFIKVNRALCKLAARDEAAMLTTRLQQITHPKDPHADDALARSMLNGSCDGYRSETRMLRPSGEVVWALLSLALVRGHDGTPRWFIAQLVDITANKLTEQTLRHQASHDALTEIWNRARLHEEIDRLAAEHRRYRQPAALMLIDLDNFKALNDTQGHDAGDRHLRAVASAIKLAIRDSDHCGRLGGDEFVVLLPQTDAKAATEVGDRIAAAIAAIPGPIDQPGLTGASIGIAVLGARIQTGHSWLRAADRAMYNAKRAGGKHGITIGA